MTVERDTLRDGARDGLPFMVAGALLALSFGVVARDAGFSALGAIVMSMVVFAGSAQFAAVGIFGAGGTLGASVAAAALMNSRFLPMGIALAPSLGGSLLRRTAHGQAVVDSSWAMALRPGGSFATRYLLGHTAVQYVGWTTGTAMGAFAGDVLGDTDALGLDAIFPAFFLSILIGELRDPHGRAVALAGGLLALALVPFTPPGVPVLAASITALVGLHRDMERPEAAA